MSSHGMFHFKPFRTFNPSSCVSWAMVDAAIFKNIFRDDLGSSLVGTLLCDLLCPGKMHRSFKFVNWFIVFISVASISGMKKGRFCRTNKKR